MRNIFFIFVLAMLVSCGGANKNLTITSFDGFKLEKITKDGIKGSVDLSVNNEFSKIKIKNLEISVYSKTSDKPLIVLMLDDLVVLAKDESQVTLPVDLKIKGGALGSILIINVLKKQRDNLYVSFNGTFKKGIISKTVNVEKMALKDALKRLNIDEMTVNKLFSTF